MTIWVLTQEVNDYNQHGAYFIDAWHEKPTIEQLAKATGMNPVFGTEALQCLFEDGICKWFDDRYILDKHK